MATATAPSYADATAPKVRVFFPRPSREEMEELMALLRNDELTVDESIALIQARVPYRQIVKTTTLVVDTGNTFDANTPANSIRNLYTSIIQTKQAPVVQEALRVKDGGIIQINMESS